MQHQNDEENHKKHNETLTSAQRAQIVWRIILQIGSDNKSNAMSIDQLLEAGIITAAYPVHTGNINTSDEEDSNNTNYRQVSRKS